MKLRAALEFQITTTGHRPDLAAISLALTSADSAAVVDQTASGEHLRIATSLDELAVLMALRGAGWPLEAAQLTRLPSQCCGGCGG